MRHGESETCWSRSVLVESSESLGGSGEGGRSAHFCFGLRKLNERRRLFFDPICVSTASSFPAEGAVDTFLFFASASFCAKKNRFVRLDFDRLIDALLEVADVVRVRGRPGDEVLVEAACGSSDCGGRLGKSAATGTEVWPSTSGSDFVAVKLSGLEDDTVRMPCRAGPKTSTTAAGDDKDSTAVVGFVVEAEAAGAMRSAAKSEPTGSSTMLLADKDGSVGEVGV